MKDYAKGYITKIRRAEKKARRLQMELDNCRMIFENNIDTMRKVYPDAWKAYCNEQGLAHDYTFGDTLV